MAEQEFVAEWFRYAEMDLTTAVFDFENMYPAPLEIICYHCQQAAEKFLKAVIIYFGKETEKTHDLSKLLNVLESFVPVSIDMRQMAVSLTQLATKTRYPETIFIDETITKNALAYAKQIKEWAERTVYKSDDTMLKQQRVYSVNTTESNYNRGLADGSHSAKIEFADKLFLKHYDIETIAELTGLSIDELETLK